MGKSKGLVYLLFAVAFLLLRPSPAASQSSISGVVKDASGSVLPRVTVEATSPALIEKSRTVTTDYAGRYSVVDIRPGTYILKFTLDGFKTVEKTGIEVPSNVTVPVNAEMGVGAVGQAVTVEAEAPLVDVQNAARTQVLSRELMDNVPSSHTFQQLAGLVPGIRLTTPDVGGSQQMEQTYIYGKGSSAYQTTVTLDGMNVNSNYLDSLIQNYIDDALIQETTYQTSGVSAETSAGGTLVNMIPKDGGNQFHGSIFAGGTLGQGGWWQASNVSPDVLARVPAGTVFGAQILEHVQNIDGSFGGPIKKDKLWFLGSSRYNSTFDSPPGVFYPKADGITPDPTNPGIEEQWIASGTLRLSWQMNSKMKFSGTYERNIKHKGHELTGVAFRPVDPSTAAQRRGGTLYYVAQGKWTYTATPRLVIDAGFSTNIIHYAVVYQVGQEQLPPASTNDLAFSSNPNFSYPAAWLAGASRTDSVTVTRTNAPGVQSFFLPDRRGVSASVSYVTGSHQIRAGFQDGWGKNDQVSSVNADLIQQYSNGAPVSVSVQNTPIASRPRVNADLGIWAQDTWTIKRLAITGGLRFEYQKSSIQPETAPAGRFVPARSFPLIDCSTIKGLGCWKTWSPRVGVSYDLFGKGKTALKASFGRYNLPADTGYLNPFNLMALSTDTRTWRDCPQPQTTCTKGGTNGDGIAQDSEIGPSTNTSFGKITSRTLDPNYKRDYNYQYHVGIQHQVMRGLSVSFDWHRRTEYNRPNTINRSVDPVNDWTPFSIVNPLTGEPITVYNLNANKVGVTPDFFQTNGTHDLNRNTYTGYEFGVNGRLKKAVFFAGWTMDRVVDTSCDAGGTPAGTASFTAVVLSGTTPGALTNSVNDPNNFRFCDQSGSLYQNLGKNVSIPYRHEFKVVGNMPVWKGFEVSMAWQSDPELTKAVNWTLTNTTRYPFDCTTCPAHVTVSGVEQGALVMPTGVTLRNPSETIPLVSPGSRYLDRLQPLELGFCPAFKSG